VHELSIIMSVLEIVEQEIRGRCDGSLRGSVREVHLRIGTLSGVEPEALRFAWEVAAADSPFCGATLMVAMAEARAACESCGSVFALGDGQSECGSCGPRGFRIVEGREMDLVRILWEDEPVVAEAAS
jgi:hydrogenase nickel incorporation protein HypA/HybF